MRKFPQPVVSVLSGPTTNREPVASVTLNTTFPAPAAAATATAATARPAAVSRPPAAPLRPSLARMAAERADSPFRVTAAPHIAAAVATGAVGGGNAGRIAGMSAALAQASSSSRMPIRAALSQPAATAASSMSQRSLPFGQPAQLSFDRGVLAMPFKPASSPATRTALPGIHPPTVMPLTPSFAAAVPGQRIPAAAVASGPRAIAAHPTPPAAAQMPRPAQLNHASGPAAPAQSIAGRSVPPAKAAASSHSFPRPIDAAAAPSHHQQRPAVLPTPQQSSPQTPAAVQRPQPATISAQPAESASTHLARLQLSPAPIPDRPTSAITTVPSRSDSSEPQPQHPNAPVAAAPTQPVRSQPTDQPPDSATLVATNSGGSNSSHKGVGWLLDSEELTEDEKAARERAEDEEARQRRAEIAAEDERWDRRLDQYVKASNDRWDAMEADHEAEMSSIRVGDRTLPQLTAAIRQWQDELTARQAEELQLEVEERVSGAVDQEQAELDCQRHCAAALAYVEAEIERQRRIEQDEDGEVDVELAAELQIDTQALAGEVARCRQAAEQLRERVAEGAEKQKEAMELLNAARELRRKRFTEGDPEA